MLIHDYAKEGNFAGISEELAKGATADARDTVQDRTPLMEAVSSPAAGLEILRLLIGNGADVNAHTCEKDAVPSLETLEEMKTFMASISKEACVGIATNFDALQGIIDSLQTNTKSDGETLVCKEYVLSLAIQSGDIEKVKVLLDNGADVHYLRPHGYDVLIDAMHGRSIAQDRQLVSLIQLLIRRGANLNGVTEYSESALNVASNHGRFDAVAVLLANGADPTPLKWTPLMRSVALGSVTDVQDQLRNHSDMSERDFWSRTAWLLSLQVGDVEKSKLLLAAGSNRSDRGRCGKPPLSYPITNNHAQMLSWLLSVGLCPDDADEFNTTPLMEAAEIGATECVKILIDAGADIHRTKHNDPVIKLASNIEIVRLLVSRGSDLNDISDEMRALMTRLPNDGRISVTRETFLAESHRRFGKTNPEKLNIAFWRSMVSSGAGAYAARAKFEDKDCMNHPVWCFRRFGKSINELPDGRIIEIGGEHEDAYDPDFMIYNDVIVHQKDGFDIYGYPEDIFQPTDFHTATHVGKYIFIIGNLGYPSTRKHDQTQVYCLNTENFEMTKILTNGEMPGWISRHKAIYRSDRTILVYSGKVCAQKDGVNEYKENAEQYALNLENLSWHKVNS